MLFIHLLAQAAVAAAAPAAQVQQDVVSYPAAFFAAQSPANADEMIVRIPGFTLDSGAGVRGYEGAAGNVLIDGKRPATKTDSLDEILRRIAASQVERIDVIRGGAPGIDMQGKTVIANVIRRKVGGIHGVAAVAITPVLNGYRAPMQMRLEANGDDSVGRHWEASFRPAGYIDDGSGDGRLSRSDGAGAPLQQGEIRAKGGGLQNTLAGVYELPLLGGSLRANGRLFWDDYRYQETDDVSLPSRVLQHDEQKQDTFDTEAGARYTRDFAGGTSLEAVALRQSERRSFNERFDAPGDQTLFSALNDTSETIVRAVLKHRHSDALSWEAGAEGADNTLDAKQRFSENGAAIPLPAANVTVEEKRWEAFGKATWQPLKPVTVEAVVREEGSTITAAGDVRLQKSLYFTKPRLAVTWAIDDKTQVRLRYEREVGQLNFSDFVASSSLSKGVLTAGNPDLNPEQDWVSEAALERRFLGAGDVSVTVRHYAIKDAQDRAPVFTAGGVFDAPANIGAGSKDELAVSATIPLDRIGLKGARLQGLGTWRWSDVTDPTTGAHREISGLRPVEWEGHFSQDIPALRLTWGVDAFGAWRETYYRFDVVETRKLHTFVMPYVEWKPQPNTAFRLEVDNLTARGFRDTITQYAGPRGSSAIAFTQDRKTAFGRYLFLRYRRTFGA